MAEPRLDGMVALVTGASRGGGKGIALVLGERGATVYVSGRSVRGEPTTLGRPGTIDDPAEEGTARGGTGIPVPRGPPEARPRRSPRGVARVSPFAATTPTTGRSRRSSTVSGTGIAGPICSSTTPGAA